MDVGFVLVMVGGFECVDCVWVEVFVDVWCCGLVIGFVCILCMWVLLCF